MRMASGDEVSFRLCPFQGHLPAKLARLNGNLIDPNFQRQFDYWNLIGALYLVDGILNIGA